MGILPSHCIVIPSYNSGCLLEKTLREVLETGWPVFLVVDGSTDGSERCAEPLGSAFGTLETIRFDENRGKGAAVIAAFEAAHARGFTHALVMDSDGQHAVRDIPTMMTLSGRNPEAMILGVPDFGADAPRLRVYWRRVGNWWTRLETLSAGIRDSLFGFRVYPIQLSLSALRDTSAGRRFDFETQLAVRLYWAGVRPLNVLSKVIYPSRSRGGVSHFRYLRDNWLLLRTHLALTLEALPQIAALLRLRRLPPLCEPGADAPLRRQGGSRSGECRH
ncbi:MAG: hypothetical protein RLZZ399_614 [Verrucomicrobiota bacterium]|jgi:glycosyltransferase involved in cell wall biosynthesis